MPDLIEAHAAPARQRSLKGRNETSSESEDMHETGGMDCGSAGSSMDGVKGKNFQRVCLTNVFRVMGIAVEDTMDGPLWILRDGTISGKRKWEILADEVSVEASAAGVWSSCCCFCCVFGCFFDILFNGGNSGGGRSSSSSSSSTGTIRVNFASSHSFDH